MRVTGADRRPRPMRRDALLADIRNRIEIARAKRERLVAELESLLPCHPALEARLQARIREAEMDLGWLQTQLQEFTDAEM